MRHCLSKILHKISTEMDIVSENFVYSREKNTTDNDSLWRSGIPKVIQWVDLARSGEEGFVQNLHGVISSK